MQTRIYGARRFSFPFYLAPSTGDKPELSDGRKNTVTRDDVRTTSDIHTSRRVAALVINPDNGQCQYYLAVVSRDSSPIDTKNRERGEGRRDDSAIGDDENFPVSAGRSCFAN